MAFTNYYEILEVIPQADAETIGKAISEKRRFWQPKTSNPKLETRQLAEKMMKDISDAETILNDAGKRADYDRQLAAQAPVADEAFPAGGGSGGRDWLKITLEYLSQGNASQANYAAREATSQQSENPEAWYFRGVSSALLDQDQDALFELNEAIRLNPNEAPYHAELGDLYKKNNAWNDAQREYQRASDLAPDNPYYQAGVGLSLSALGELEKGTALLKAAHERIPDDELVRYYYGASLLESATAGWSTFHDGSQSILSEAQLNVAAERLTQIEALKIDDREFQNDVDEVRVHVENASKVKLRWNGCGEIFGLTAVVPWIAALLVGWLLAALSGFPSDPGWLVIPILLVWAAVLVLVIRWRRMPGWKWDRKQAPAYARATGLQ